MGMTQEAGLRRFALGLLSDVVNLGLRNSNMTAMRQHLVANSALWG